MVKWLKRKWKEYRLGRKLKAWERERRITTYHIYKTYFK